MRALYVILPILGILAIAYRYYSAFIAARVMVLDDTRVDPGAHPRTTATTTMPTTGWVLFGHHFAAIAGAGSAHRPGARGAVRLRARADLAGRPASASPAPCTTSSSCGRRRAAAAARWPRSRAREIGPVAGHDRGGRDPLHHRHRARRARPRRRQRAAAERLGHVHDRRVDPARALHGPVHVPVPARARSPRRRSSASPGCSLAVDPRQAARRVVVRRTGSVSSRTQLIVADGGLRLRRVGAAGLAAALPARLPQLVHEDRHDRVAGRRRHRRQPACCRCRRSRQFIGGGGPIVPGPLFPFAFITIACGAISGFHALIASGTTPKMIDRESRHPADRLRRDADGRARRHHGAHRRDARCSRATTSRSTRRRRCSPTLGHAGRQPAGRSRRRSARASPAAPAARCRWRSAWRRSSAACPGMRGLMDYWYHFAIMFEALFILTTIDTGTRVARFLVAGVPRPLLRAVRRGTTGCPGAIVSTAARRRRRGRYFIWTGSICTIWPMFGIANQLLASVALAVGTTIIINAGQGALRLGHAAAAVVRRRSRR